MGAMKNQAVKTTEKKAGKGPQAQAAAKIAAQAATHGHYCPVHHDRWVHKGARKVCKRPENTICDPCWDKKPAGQPALIDASRPSAMASVITMPREPKPESHNLGEVLGLKPETPEETPAAKGKGTAARKAAALAKAEAITETPVERAPAKAPPKAAKATVEKAKKVPLTFGADYVPAVLPSPDRCLTPGCPRLDDLRGLCAKCYTHVNTLIREVPGLSWEKLEAEGKAKPKAPQGASDLPHRRAWLLGEWAPAAEGGLTLEQIEALPRKPKGRKTA